MTDDLQQRAREMVLVLTLTYGEWIDAENYTHDHPIDGIGMVLAGKRYCSHDEIHALIAYRNEIAAELTSKPRRTAGAFVRIGVFCEPCLGDGKVRRHPYCSGFERCDECGGDGRTHLGRAVTRVLEAAP